MVDFIRTWGTALICAAIIGSLCNLLLPKHPIAKVARVLVGLYLAIVMISPFLDSELQIPDSIDLDWSVLRAERGYDDAISAETARLLQGKLDAAFRLAGIQPDSVEVGMHINAEGGIDCGDVTLVFPVRFREQQEEILQITNEIAGVTPTILYRD